MAEESKDVEGTGPAEGPKEPFVIERARSSRSKCKGCKKAIQQGKFRFGLLIEGPFGPGYLWHHLACAAKRRFEDVAEAYEALGAARDPELPDLEELRAEVDRAEQKKAERKTPPYVELAPTGRSKCKHCGEGIDKDAPRVVLLRSVEFYGQTRSGPINVHPRCVSAALAADDNATEVEGFADAMRATSSDVDASVVDSVLREIGSVGG